jgi:pyruvate dehydrogenase E2 component (dihydrolipoyllysine-residue acetyltransferase)
MATVVKMPKWGLTMTAGTVTGWLYDEGAEISEGDPIFTVETEKAVNDVEAPADGVLVKIVASQGDEVPVSGPVAIIAAPGEAISEAELAALIAEAAPKKSSAATTAAAAGGARAARVASRDESGRVNASPAARRRAQELGVDLATIEATGPDGRITSDDVERAAAEASADPTPREERIRLDDGRELNILLAGTGDAPPLVFLHGLGGSQSTWQVVLGDLVEQHRVAAIDLPGHGTSDRSAEADYSITGIAHAIAEAVGKLGLSRPIVVGHSLGGAVALRIAIEQPKLIQGVVALDSAGLGEEISSELTDLMGGQAGTDTARGLLQLFYQDQKLVNERGVAEMAQMQLADGAWAAQQSVANAAFASGRQLQAARLDPAAVSVPVLLIWGEHDRVIPARHAIEALTRFPDASLAIVPNVGHVPQVENPNRTATLITRFTRSLG